MTVYILTLFPEIFESVFAKSIIARAVQKKLVDIKTVNIRDFSKDKHKKVDDRPYGGGEGMIMMVEPIADALASLKEKPYIILLSASGKKFNQNMARDLSKKKSLAFICGHYEGVDARVEKFADEIVSIGDFILTGGEIPAMAIVDSVTRFLPGSINPKSPIDESFEKGLLEYPHYTKPVNFMGARVPKILLSGNHAEIAKWRKQKSLERTKKFRPDLVKKRT